MSFSSLPYTVFHNPGYVLVAIVGNFGFRVAVGIFVGRFYQGIDGGYFPLRQCFPDNLIIFHQLDGFPVVLLIGPAQHIGDGGDSIG